MAPKVSAASVYSSHESSILSASSITCSINNNNKNNNARGLELSSSSHSIAKHKTQKKGPIIRVVHVFAPTLIQTDVANFRMLVQKLTGNHSSSNDEEEAAAKEEDSHDHTNHSYFNQSMNHTKQLELRYQKEEEATIPAYSSAMLNTQLEENYGILQTGFNLASNHTKFTTRIHESIGYFTSNHTGLARIEERDGYFPAASQDVLARGDEGINFFPANYGYDDVYSHSSPTSLDSSSTRGSCFNYETDDNPCVFNDELDFKGGYSLINLDDQNLPQLFMSALDTNLV